MDVDRRLERLCERVTLVDGVGSRWRGELCVMSFVALLGGERHTDHPASASPLVRDFAVRVNDAMPRDVRQRLKPFAVRILGTDDGCDRARAEVLRRALAREIQPRVRRDWGAAGRGGERGHVPFEAFAGTFCFAGTAGWDIAACAASLLAQIERPLPPRHETRVGAAVGELLARCMREAATREQRGWYWDEAIGLLDRLCDVGAPPGVGAGRDPRRGAGRGLVVAPPRGTLQTAGPRSAHLPVGRRRDPGGPGRARAGPLGRRAECEWPRHWRGGGGSGRLTGSVLVLGSGDVASAVAHALLRAGVAVALQDGPAPPAASRRGMAFADAFFDGQTTLAGVTARRLAKPADLRATLDAVAFLPFLAGTVAEALAAAPWASVVDARMRKRATPEDLRPWAPLAVGLGPGFVAGDGPGANCHAAVETSWEALGELVRSGPTLPLRGEPLPIAGVGRERAVYAVPIAGLFRTGLAIGASVAAVEPIGMLDGRPVLAPLAGVLRGLVRDGVLVEAGAKVAEVDPRGDPALCFGLGERPRQIAKGVSALVLCGALRKLPPNR